MQSTENMLRRAMSRRTPAPVLDSATSPVNLAGADTYTMKDIAMSAVAAVQQWVETDDLDSGETYADRLMAMFVGIADANKDGDITEDEQGVLEVALNAAWDYLVKLGVSDDDAGALLNDWDSDTADRVRDLVASVLPDSDGDGGDGGELDNFVFSASDQEPLLDAAYRKTIAMRSGKKVRINKRISGSVRLSAKQKISIRKARMKSHSASAMMHRLKSMRMRHKAGM